VDSVRIDKWLWASRFFKTRQLAQEAINGGKAHLNGQRVKPSKLLNIDDEITIRKGPFSYHVLVKKLVDKRVSAKLAAELYEESEESIDERETVSFQLKAQSLYTPIYT